MMPLIAALLLAQAAAKESQPGKPQGEIPAAASLHSRKRLPPDLKAVDRHLVGANNMVLADDLVDEMVDEFAADVARLGAAQVGPILIQRIRVSNNVNPDYAAVLQARLAAAVFRAANVALVRCLECTSTRTRVEGGEWVVSRGLTTREEAQAVAKKYGAMSFLDVSLTVRERPTASMGMDVEMVRAQDSSIAFAETYRMDGSQGLLYRGADRFQSREAKLKELQDKLNQRPRWSQALEIGAMGLLGDHTIWGTVARYQLAEEFGDDHEYQAGIGLGGFFSFPGAPLQLTSGLVGAMFQARIGGESLFVPKFWLGLDAGAFIAGNTGTAPIFGGTLRWQVAQRIALRLGVRYMVPQKVPSSTQSFGGFSPELGVGFVWN